MAAILFDGSVAKEARRVGMLVFCTVICLLRAIPFNMNFEGLTLFHSFITKNEMPQICRADFIVFYLS